MHVLDGATRAGHRNVHVLKFIISHGCKGASLQFSYQTGSVHTASWTRGHMVADNWSWNQLVTCVIFGIITHDVAKYGTLYTSPNYNQCFQICDVGVIITMLNSVKYITFKAMVKTHLFNSR